MKLPDDKILSSGNYIKIIFKEYLKITGEFPDFCDCRLKTYLSIVKTYYKANG